MGLWGSSLQTWLSLMFSLYRRKGICLKVMAMVRWRVEKRRQIGRLPIPLTFQDTDSKTDVPGTDLGQGCIPDMAPGLSEFTVWKGWQASKQITLVPWRTCNQEVATGCRGNTNRDKCVSSEERVGVGRSQRWVSRDVRTELGLDP